MEVKVTGYTPSPGESFLITIDPPIPYEESGTLTWNLFPDKDDVYHVTVTSNVSGQIHSEEKLSVGVLTNKLNTLTMGVKKTEKEDLIEADLRAIVSCFAIEEYDEARNQIEMATELWII